MSLAMTSKKARGPVPAKSRFFSTLLGVWTIRLRAIQLRITKPGFIRAVRQDRFQPITLEDGIIPIDRLSLDFDVGQGDYAD